MADSVVCLMHANLGKGCYGQLSVGASAFDYGALVGYSREGCRI